MFNNLINTTRLLRILFILARCNVLPYTRWLADWSLRNKSLGEKLVITLEALGPTFIKLGQSLSSRVDIVGDEVATHFLTLCDRLPPFSHHIAVAIIAKELGSEVHDVFAEFPASSIAAASIAQVYKARLVSGEAVAVKVLRPNIDKVFARDISMFKWLANIAVRFKTLQRLKPREIVETFAETCKFELDLRFEGANAEELRENTKNDQGFRVPKVYWKSTTRRILTTEWIEGTPVYDVEQLHNSYELAKNLIITFCNQCYRDCFFHADMHPGNLIVDTEGRLTAVDFGIMGRLDKMTGIYVAEILSGFLRRDYHHVATIHLKAGYIEAKYYNNFISACRAIGAPIVGKAIENISAAKLLSQLFKITADFNMPVQPQLALLQKTMILVEGTCRRLSPNINMWEVAESWIKEHKNKRTRYIAQAKDSTLLKMIKDFPVFAHKINLALDVIIADKQQKPPQKPLMGNTLTLLLIILLIAISLFCFYSPT